MDYRDYKQRLRCRRTDLLSSIYPDKVVDYLFQEEVIDQDVMELIMAIPTRKGQAVELLNRLQTTTAEGFKHFVDSLKETFPHLHELMKKPAMPTEGPEREAFVEQRLREGQVPPRPDVFAQRPTELATLRSALRQLQDTDGWVVLHGMGGCGKTLLAAESLRDGSLLFDCFPNGVIWLTIGQLSDEDGQVDSAKLLMKMQNLCTRLDRGSTSGSNRPNNIEAAHDRLVELFAHDYPQALLVLDDVWSQVVARAFSVRCRVLVTSRFRSVANQARVPKKVFVPLTSGFTLEQTRIVLSGWTGFYVDSLPPEAAEIHDECKGLPLAVAMLGALLHRDPKQLRWEYYLRQLKAKKLDQIRSAGMESDFASLSASIAISVEALERDHKDIFDYYKLFAVFDDDATISSQVLSVLWGKSDPMEVEDLMEVIVGMSLAHHVSGDKVILKSKSLLRQAGEGSSVDQDTFPSALSASQHLSVSSISETPPFYRRRRFSRFDFAYYSLHDLQLDYLKEQLVSREETEAMHKRLVDGYQRQCNGDFHLLLDDGYVHGHIGQHLVESGNIDVWCRLLTDLRWVSVKLKYCGIGDMLRDYLKITEIQRRPKLPVGGQNVAVPTRRRRGQKPQKAVTPTNPRTPSRHSSIDPMIIGELQSFQRFVSIHAHHLLEDPSLNVTQLALLQPSTTSVFQQAVVHGKQAVTKDRAFFVKLCNAVEDVQSHLLTVNLHQSPISHCQYSPAGISVASCSSDESVRLWSSATGSLMGVLEGHSGNVVHCDFNRAGDRIVSCSEDGSVKVWSLQGDIEGGAQQLVEYLSHQSDGSFPLCCSFSPDGFRVASCDLSGALAVWECDSLKDVFYKANAHDSMIQKCQYSPDGQLIATVAYDALVKLWDADSGQLVCTFSEHKGIVYCCSFSRDGRLVSSSEDTSLRVWSTSGQSTDSLATLRQESFLGMMSCAFSPDNKLIAGGSADGHLVLYDAHDYSKVVSLMAHSGWVTAISFSPNGEHFVTSSDDEMCKVWEVTKCQQRNHKRVQWSRRLDLKTVGEDIFLAVQELDKPRPVKIFEGLDLVEKDSLLMQDDHVVKSFALSSDAQTVVMASDKGRVEICRRGVERAVTVCQSETTVHSGAIRFCHLSPDDRFAVTASDDGIQAVWSVADGSLVSKGSGLTSRHVPFVFFPDEPWLLSAGTDESLRVWDMSSGTTLHEWPGNDGELKSLAVSSNAAFLASCGASALKLWTIDSASAGHLQAELRGHTDVVRSCAFSPDGTRVASGSDDGSMKLWDMKTFREVARCTGHKGWIIDMAFSEDSALLVTVSDRIKWWLAENGTHIRTVFLDGIFTKNIRTDPIFSVFATVDNYGRLYLLDTLTEDDDDQS